MYCFRPPFQNFSISHCAVGRSAACFEPIYRVAQKSKPLPKWSKDRTKSYYSLSMRLYLFAKSVYESSTIISFVGIRYSIHDLFSDFNYYAWRANIRHASDTVNNVSASYRISLPSKLWILCLNDLLDEYLCQNVFYFLFALFFWFSNMILSDALILPISQLKTQQVMTSLIRSHIEYLIQTCPIAVLIL